MGEDHGLDPVTQVELAQDRAEVSLDGRLREVEPTGDLLVAQALADSDEDLPLPVGEPVESIEPDVRPGRPAATAASATGPARDPRT